MITVNYTPKDPRLKGATEDAVQGHDDIARLGFFKHPLPIPRCIRDAKAFSSEKLRL